MSDIDDTDTDDSTVVVDDVAEDSTDYDEEDILGGLDVETSKDIDVPDRLIDQVIGQDHARNVVEKAANRGRHLLMIGSPGTGKSMLAKAMTELMPDDTLQDVLVYPNPDDDMEPKVRTVPAGKGSKIVEAHEEEVNKKKSFRTLIVGIISIVILGYGFISGQVLMGLIAAAIVFLGYKFVSGDVESQSPKVLIDNSDATSAPFNDATGSHSGALLGDVRHDPYQSGGMSTPAHQRVESGKIHESNNGVLFIDEVNTLDIEDQQNLMTAIQDEEFSITGQSKQSSGSMVQTEKVPTNFTMVAAGNMDAIENMHPALRDRLQSYGYEVYMDDKVDDTPEMRRKYARFVAQEVENDDMPHLTRDAIVEVIKEARRRAGEKGKLTLQLRNLGEIVRNGGDIAIDRGADIVTREHVLEGKKMAKSVEQQVVNRKTEKKEKYAMETDLDSKIGHVNGLAVMGETSGIVLPLVATVTPSQSDGQIIATGKLQEIAQEAVQNVSALIKKISGETIEDKDVHIQFVQTYEGVDGDSASVTIATVVLSALTAIPVRQNVAMTGSLSVRGEVLPVGGVTHKIEAAVESGMDEVIIPKSNENDVMIEDKYKDQITIHTAEHLGDVLEVALETSNDDLDRFLEALKQEQKTGLLSLSDLSPSGGGHISVEGNNKT